MNPWWGKAEVVLDWILRGMNCKGLRAFVLLVVGFHAVAVGQDSSFIRWSELDPIPDQHGLAGMFAGVSHGVLIAAGGANFPDAPPWQNGTKVWHDTIFAL